MPDPIRVAFLYSAPLVHYDLATGTARPIDLLNWQAEKEILFDSFTEARKLIEIRVEPATTDRLRTLITLGCRVLHYSGHGHPDFLALEDGRGVMHPLPNETLRDLLSAGSPNGVKVAFVSACHSLRAGEAFVAAGVPHVIAVRLDTGVYDDSARAFARHFYLALAAGRTVKQAFEIGRESVGAMPGLAEAGQEKEKFLLLPEDGSHDVPILADAPAGQWLDATPPLAPTNLPARPEGFLGRNAEMQAVVADLIDSRLAVLRGAPGIGKTALAIEASHYLHQRGVFPDGIFFVSLRGVHSTEGLRAGVAAAVDSQAQDDRGLIADLRTRRCLLVWDNSEDILYHAPAKFHQLLSELLQQAPGVRVLITSRQAVGGGLSGISLL